jgi:Fur family ferric uptake transcriptional regulator|tara:strand:- start:77 stop:499 length:423 start_codon:yes stop_codon:yes gene_type:complete
VSSIKSQHLVEVLRKEGLRYTSQRQAVWDEIKKSEEHRDVEDIYLQLKSNNHNVSRATVYRTIDVLVKNHMVRKMDLGDGRNLFEPRIDDEHHDHMICLDTGKIIEFFDEELEDLQDKIAEKHGYKVVRHVHQLFVKPIK